MLQVSVSWRVRCRGGQVARTVGEEGDAFAQTLAQILEAERADLRSRELDRQGEAVHPTADLASRLRFEAVPIERRVACERSSREQSHRIVDRQRLERKEVLS